MHLLLYTPGSGSRDQIQILLIYGCWYFVLSNLLSLYFIYHLSSLHKSTCTCMTGEGMWGYPITGHRRDHSQLSFCGSFLSSIGWSDQIRSDSFHHKHFISDTPALRSCRVSILPSICHPDTESADVCSPHLPFFSSVQ